MRTENLIVAFLFANLVGIPVIACIAKTPAKVSVDKDISVAVYSQHRVNDTMLKIAVN